MLTPSPSGENTPTLNVLGDYQTFLDSVFGQLELLKIDVTRYYLDHICYRVDTDQLYQAKKSQLSQIATMLHESLIGGRLIAIYKLSQPLEYWGRSVDIIELPAPKQGRIDRPGLEHVEFVLDEPFEQFVARYPHVLFDQSGVAKTHNPEVELKFPDLGFVVRFHQMSMEDIVEKEKREGK